MSETHKKNVTTGTEEVKLTLEQRVAKLETALEFAVTLIHKVKNALKAQFGVVLKTIVTAGFLLSSPVLEAADTVIWDPINASAWPSATAKITIGSGGTATMIVDRVSGDGSALTGINGANLSSGNIAYARLTNALVQSFTEGILKDSMIVSGDIKDGEIVDADTTLTAAAIASGNIAYARLTNALAQSLTEGIFKDSMIVSGDIKDGEIVDADTTLTAAAIASGNIAYARLTNALVQSFTEGILKDSTIVSADVKDGEIVDADTTLTAAAIASGNIAYDRITNALVQSFTEGILKDSMIVSGDIKDGEIVDADTTLTAAAIASGNIAYARMTNALAESLTEGIFKDSMIVSADIKDGEIANADVSASAGITVAKLGASGRGTTQLVAAASETVGEVNKTVLTVAMANYSVPNGGLTTNALLYTFPAGRILVLGVTVNATVTNTANFEASDNDHYSVSLGGVGNGDSTADATEVNLMAAKDCDTSAGSVLSFTWGAGLAASTQLDGTSTAVPVWAHIFVANTQDSGDNVFGIAGTITIHWVNLGDY